MMNKILTFSIYLSLALSLIIESTIAISAVSLGNDSSVLKYK